jgi:hypothetical protein
MRELTKHEYEYMMGRIYFNQILNKNRDYYNGGVMEITTMVNGEEVIVDDCSTIVDWGKATAPQGTGATHGSVFFYRKTTSDDEERAKVTMHGTYDDMIAFFKGIVNGLKYEKEDV